MHDVLLPWSPLPILPRFLRFGAGAGSGSALGFAFCKKRNWVNSHSNFTIE